MSFLAGAITGNMILNTSGFTGGVAGMISAATAGGPSMAAPLLAAANLIEETFKKVFDFIKEAIGSSAEKWDNMGEAAERAGVSTQFLSSMGMMAKDAGSSVEGLGDAIKFLNKNMSQAAEGEETSLKSFQKLGITQQDIIAAGGDTESVFRRVVDAVKDLDTTAAKTDVTMELLGRGGSELIPFINQGTEGMDKWRARADKLGVTIDDQMAQGGDAFKRLGVMWDGVWEGIKGAVAKPILSAIAGDSDQLEGTITRISEMIRSYIPPALKFIAGIVDLILNGADKALAVLQLMAKVSDGLGITDNLSNDVAAGRTAIAGGRQLIQDVKVNIQASLDAKDASSQIAGKLQPELATIADRQTKELSGAARRALVAGKTGGKALS